MKTTLHIKTYHLRQPDDARDYRALREKLFAMGLKPLEFARSSGNDGFRYELFKLDGKEVELETKYLFDNQWNTAPVEGLSETGFRVFDWSDSHIWDVDKVRTVQWLEQTDEMTAIRADMHRCGYCSNMQPKALVPAGGFCDQCLDSEYLKRSDLFLLRMRPVSSREDRKPLTDDEIAILSPRFVDAQVNGSTERGKLRLAKARQRNEDRYKAAHIKAEIEYIGTKWILDNVPNMEGNAIYYSHTGRWCFGWNKPLSEDEASFLLDRVSEFPYVYDIKKEGA